MKYLGKATLPDSPSVAELYKRACDLDHAQACANYAILLGSGEHGADKDPEASERFHEKACKLGHTPSCE